MREQAEGDSDRRYNSHHEEAGKKPTEAETEAYNLIRTYSSDPMAAEINDKWAKKASKKSKKS